MDSRRAFLALVGIIALLFCAAVAVRPLAALAHPVSGTASSSPTTARPDTSRARRRAVVRQGLVRIDLPRITGARYALRLR
jgi:hypothetical protein